uniref:Uncharacterized protein n=1 Tax=Lepeophtheirus salmonis TaxID=72036 RepID=A0A0K2V0W5_LEPSM
MEIKILFTEFNLNIFIKFIGDHRFQIHITKISPISRRYFTNMILPKFTSQSTRTKSISFVNMTCSIEDL